MKTYVTWEVFKSLTENPKQSFKRVCDGLIIHAESAYLDTKTELVWGSGRKKIAIEDTWELIQEPVGFMTAVKAYAEGKTIRCERPGTTTIYSKNYCNNMVDQLGRTINAHEILKGEWFISE